MEPQMFVWQLGIPWDKAAWDSVYKFLAVAKDESELEGMIEPFRKFIDKEMLPHHTQFESEWHELTVTKIGIALPEQVPGWFDYSTKFG